MLDITGAHWARAWFSLPIYVHSPDPTQSLLILGPSDAGGLVRVGSLMPALALAVLMAVLAEDFFG